jgi:hypothetical protein
MRVLASVPAILGLAALGIAAMPHDAKAWWRDGVGIAVWVPPVVVVPPPVGYAPPPVAYVPPPPYYYVPPHRIWVPPHWEGPYWVHGHWS